MESPQETAHRHSARAEHLHLRAALQRIFREPGRAAGEHRLFRLHDVPICIARARAAGPSIPCFPAKIGISHVYNLIQEKHRKKPLECDFLPMYDVLTSPLVKIVGANACPTVTATPETVKAAFTKENDVFAEHNVKYIDPVLNFADRKLFAHQMLQAWQPIMGLSQEENDRAVEVGYKALEDYEASIRSARGRYSINWNAKTASAS
jgi:predicted nucleotide-binding protein (sugar kinase/HSP70/actin superfamily)